MKAKSYLTAIVSLLTISSPLLQAEPVYEGFPTGTGAGQYTPGSDPAATKGIGTGWQDSWKNTAERKMMAIAKGLQYPGLQTTPGGVWSPDSDGNAELIRDFPGTGAVSEVWFSVLMDRDSIGSGYEDRFAFQFRSHTNGLKYAIHAKDDSQQWHVTYVPLKGGRNTFAIPGTQYDAPTFIIGRIQGLGTAATSLSLWANPEDLTNPGEPVWTSENFQGQGFGRVVLVTDGKRVGIFDEIRIGSSYAEVVPTTSEGSANQ